MEPPNPNTTPGQRPSSVPSWMSELKGQPGVPALPPRQRAAHLIDGAAPTSRPRAPIVAPTAQSPDPTKWPRRRSAPSAKKERAPPRSLTESWGGIELDFVVEDAGRFTGAFGLGASPGLPRLQPSQELSGGVSGRACV